MADTVLVLALMRDGYDACARSREPARAASVRKRSLNATSGVAASWPPYSVFGLARQDLVGSRVA